MRRSIPLLLAAALGALAARAAAPTAQARPDAPGPPDFAAVAARAEPGVVYVQNWLKRPRDVPDPGEPSATVDSVGSGFVWAPDGWIVTNRHVTEGAKQLVVDVHGRGRFLATQVGEDRVADVALLKIDATGLVPLAVGDPRSLRVGQWVLAAGSPYRLARSFSVGIVSGLNRSDVGVNPEGYEDFIQTDAAVNLGNSGGPLLDGEGRVVGMNTAILSRTAGNQGIAFAVPIDVVLEAVEQLRAGRPVRRTWIGAVVRQAPIPVAMSLPGGAGVEVLRFQDPSEAAPAKRAGLKAGDVILRVDGVPVGTKAELQRLIWSKRPGTTVRIDAWRDRAAFATTCVLGER